VTAAAALRAPGIARRLACALYELLILAAVVLIATFPFLAFVGDATQGWRRHLLQLWVLGIVGAYLGGFWTHGGQTLAMKTWRVRLVREDGGRVNWGRALHRYFLAILGLAAAGAGFLYAFIDRDRQFLHDRLAGTRLVATEEAL